MGISGLLPLLKSIQVNKHLSEFAGQTLAVDAYVWLHRGIYTCATELATGKNTTKYVDYAMHRVRLLRYHHIQPFLVFDGGPLPAKRGTDAERKQRRKENMARGNILAAQGKHTEAREYYGKCVDVTPQMAYQLIKALKAEAVPYIVSPYEADAQLAYLEKVGIVDGVITEDSDLLVFGCQTVLTKLDSVSSTITSISRSDFASLTSSASSKGKSISLLGWSDVQFRAMSILSGCDYLPSIPGVGLKTAWVLLKKYKTPENVVRALKLEGKKAVPKGYMEKYKKAERVFLYQRVWDPVSGKLVHLNEVPDGEKDGWDEEMEEYVGKKLDAELAKKITTGDICPVSLDDMVDINPGYKPRALCSLPLDHNRPGVSKSKENTKQPPTKGILNFFSRAPKPTKAPPSLAPVVKVVGLGGMVVGRASGKRTLTDVMDEDLAAKRKKVCGSPRVSRFFASPSKTTPGGGPSHSEEISHASSSHAYDPFKENVPPLSDVEVNFGMAKTEPDLDVVMQEDGYISPSPSYDRDDSTPELSSPIRPDKRAREANDDDFDVDAISSPVTTRQARGSGRIVKHDTPTPTSSTAHQRQEWVDDGVDLRNAFMDDLTSEIDGFDDEQEGKGRGNNTATPSPSPPTPVDEDVDLELELELTDLETETSATRTEIVASGWWTKYAADGKRRMMKPPPLKRYDTVVTPAGRHPGIHRRPKPSRSDTRKRLPFAATAALKKASEHCGDDADDQSGSDSDDGEQQVVQTAQARLARFRCP